MSFSQSPTTTLPPVPSVFARLGGTVRARIPVFKSCMPSFFTVKGRKHLSKRKSRFVSSGAGAKRKSFIPSLKLSLSSLSSSLSRSSVGSPSSPMPVCSGTSISSTTDICSLLSSPICTPVLLVPPPVGMKITDRFWPEEDPEHSDPTEVSVSGSVAFPRIVNVLSPPPYHRRSPSAVVQQDNLLSSDKYPSHYRDQDDSLPLRFPF
ncbi:hypothetical protein M405DRAFT_496022 [Rhizopogon salebrosus TDB-379]|nr:hypothetical protein M405DRAFT_496022 [Rhizopogon salebrosus TDB-379]